MSAEPLFSLRAAAKYVGMDYHTLKARLVADLGMEFPPIRRGQHFLIRESLLQQLIRRYSPESNQPRLRMMRAAGARKQVAC